MCVCVFIYEGECAFAHENGCVHTPVHIFVEARGQLQKLYSWLFWERGSLAGLRLASLDELAGHQAPRTGPSLPSQLWGYKCMPPCLVLCVVSGNQTQGLVCLRQIL